MFIPYWIIYPTCLPFCYSRRKRCYHIWVSLDGELVYRLKFAVISHNNKSLLAGCVQLISHIWLNVTYPSQIMSMLACSVLNMEQTKTILINNLSLCILGYQSILSGEINAALLFPQQHVLFYAKHAFGIIHKQHNTIDFILVSTHWITTIQ